MFWLERVTPKGETQLTPEESYLEPFLEKASDVKDTSLKVPSGMSGTVIDVQVFTREGVTRDKRAQEIIDNELDRFRKDLDDQLRIVEFDTFERARRLLVGSSSTGGPNNLERGSTVSNDYLNSVAKHHWFDVRLADEKSASSLEGLKESLDQKKEQFDLAFKEKRKNFYREMNFP